MKVSLSYILIFLSLDDWELYFQRVTGLGFPHVAAHSIMWNVPQCGFNQLHIIHCTTEKRWLASTKVLNVTRGSCTDYFWRVLSVIHPHFRNFNYSNECKCLTYIEQTVFYKHWRSLKASPFKPGVGDMAESSYLDLVWPLRICFYGAFKSD